MRWNDLTKSIVCLTGYEEKGKVREQIHSLLDMTSGNSTDRYRGSSNNNTISHNICNGNGAGINLVSSSNNTITDNNCSGNSDEDFCIALFYSSNNIVSYNNCRSDGIVIYSNSSDNNLFCNSGIISVITDPPGNNNLMWVIVITLVLLIGVIVFVTWGRKPKTP
jgi:parallel beta-helix repeat protein